MDSTTKDILGQLDDLLAASHQSWLFGAGISLDAGIPLMWPLTERVFKRAQDEGQATDVNVLNFVKNQLTEDAPIEHILSQLGDHRAIADRSKDKNVTFDGAVLSVEDLDSLHQRVLTWIAETIRWGYKPAKPDGSPEEIGTHEKRIVAIDQHLEFVSAKQESRSAEELSEFSLPTMTRFLRMRLPWAVSPTGTAFQVEQSRIEVIGTETRNRTSGIARM